jgi:hypothetical protein
LIQHSFPIAGFILRLVLFTDAEFVCFCTWSSVQDVTMFGRSLLFYNQVSWKLTQSDLVKGPYDVQAFTKCWTTHSHLQQSDLGQWSQSVTW